MIVGAFPGPLEDKNRAPFSGPTGKLIERLAKALRLDPARDLFFTQVVRCFDGSAEPALTPEHVEACRPWLVAQIETIRPRVILALGEVPLRWFTGGVGDIEAMRGQWISWRGFDVMPTVMPQSWMDEATLARCRAEWRLAASRKWSADGAVWHGRGALNGRE
jgi:DNA polymerase